MGADAGIDRDDLDRAVEVLRGMAYHLRLHILVLLRGGEATPAALCAATAASPTVVSHHLRNLTHAGLIRRRRRGRHVYYSLPGESTDRLVDEIISFALR